ncbi:MAG: cation transporter [Hyphomicrobiales bacterium]|nr:cation transporter [Hyphomicrobiales bacterium]MCP5370398.1 cation transporter [Hyphomicrobiales bacterium]
MSACCDHDHRHDQPDATGAYRRVLWVVLAINAAMFAGETVAGHWGRSVSLQADALDFLADAATYAITLLALAHGARWRARAALLKGAAMGAFSLWVIGSTVAGLILGNLPHAGVMGGVGLLALAANVTSAALLFRFRGGDANMESVWLCSRNDAIANIAVIAAASGVWATHTGWPDLLVAAIIAGLAGSASVRVLRRALGELRQVSPAPAE